jgi:hypothetical protein
MIRNVNSCPGNYYKSVQVFRTFSEYPAFLEPNNDSTAHLPSKPGKAFHGSKRIRGGFPEISHFYVTEPEE